MCTFNVCANKFRMQSRIYWRGGGAPKAGQEETIKIKSVFLILVINIGRNNILEIISQKQSRNDTK